MASVGEATVKVNVELDADVEQQIRAIVRNEISKPSTSATAVAAPMTLVYNRMSHRRGCTARCDCGSE